MTLLILHRIPIFIQFCFIKSHLRSADLLLGTGIDLGKGCFRKFILMKIFLRFIGIL